jgi:hypothetical protein
LALSGHFDPAHRCPLSEVKQTITSENDDLSDVPTGLKKRQNEDCYDQSI